MPSGASVGEREAAVGVGQRVVTNSTDLSSDVQDPPYLLSTRGPELEIKPCLTLRKSEENHTTPCTLFQHD